MKRDVTWDHTIHLYLNEKDYKKTFEGAKSPTIWLYYLFTSFMNTSLITYVTLRLLLWDLILSLAFCYFLYRLRIMSSLYWKIFSFWVLEKPSTIYSWWLFNASTLNGMGTRSVTLKMFVWWNKQACNTQNGFIYLNSEYIEERWSKCQD